MLYATSKSVRPDAQGRVIVPEELRAKVGIGTELVAVGAIDRVELWAPDPQSDHVCDLTLPTQVDAQKTLALLPPPVAEVLQRPEMLVSNLLEALTR